MSGPPPACHDTGSAVAAVPFGPSPERGCYVSSGTWSLMGVEVSAPIITPQSLEYNFTNEGGVCSTFRLLKNIMGLWLVQECRRVWARQGASYSYDELTRMAEQASPLHALVNPDDTVAFRRVVNVPKRSIGDTSVGHVDRFAEAEGLSFREALARSDENGRLSNRAQRAIKEFVALIDHLAAQAAHGPRAALEATRVQQAQYASSIVPMLDEQAAEVEQIARLGEVDTLILLETVQRQFEAKSRLLDLRQSLTGANHHTGQQIIVPTQVLRHAVDHQVDAVC